MKAEQIAIRKIIIRMHTIRDTDFVPSAYAVVELLAFAISLGMVFIQINPFYEALFFTVLISFLLSYMITLIKDLDNPFDYRLRGESGNEVSLKPFHDVEKRLLAK